MHDWAYMQYEYGCPVSDVNYPFCLSSKSQLWPAWLSLLSWLFGTGNQKKHPPMETTKKQTKNTNNYNNKINSEETHLQVAHPTRPASCSAQVFPVGLTRFCSHGNRQWHLLPLAPWTYRKRIARSLTGDLVSAAFSNQLVAGTSCNQRRLGGGTVANYLGLWFRFATNSHESLWFQTGLIRAIGWIMMDIEGSTWLGPYASFWHPYRRRFFCITNTHTQENHRAENNSISNGFLTRWN